MSDYKTNFGFIIFDDECGAIRCDAVKSFGLSKNNLNVNFEYCINDKCILSLKTSYNVDLKQLAKYITTSIINHLKFNSDCNLDINELIKNYNTTEFKD